PSLLAADRVIVVPPCKSRPSLGLGCLSPARNTTAYRTAVRASSVRRYRDTFRCPCGAATAVPVSLCGRGRAVSPGATPTARIVPDRYGRHVPAVAYRTVRRRYATSSIAANRAARSTP